VHFVVPQLDAGPIVVQGRIRVYPDDTPDTLAQRVHELEYRIYPQAIRWFAEGRLTLRGNSACLDGLPVRL
jgi:phosphoribosylglycinamide formyltransferase-1